MYGVERNAKANADKAREMLKADGKSDKTAGRIANRQEQRETRQGNKGVNKHVGLN